MLDVVFSVGRIYGFIYSKFMFIEILWELSMQNSSGMNRSIPPQMLLKWLFWRTSYTSQEMTCCRGLL